MLILLPPCSPSEVKAGIPLVDQSAFGMGVIFAMAAASR